MNLLLQYILLGISLAAPIGPTSIEILRRGLRYGFRSALLVQLGALSADISHLLIVLFGLSYIANIVIIRQLLILLGAVVLLFFGYSSIKGCFNKAKIDINKSSKEGNPYAAGYLITILNPYAILWWFGIYGSMIVSDNGSLLNANIVLNSLSILFGITIWATFLSILTIFGKRFANEKKMKYVSFIAGIILIYFGLNLAFKSIILLWDLV